MLIAPKPRRLKSPVSRLLCCRLPALPAHHHASDAPDFRPPTSSDALHHAASTILMAACTPSHTRWASSRTAGVLRLGVQQVTVPLAWPRCSTAFQGFCAITPHGPSRVLCCATSCPVLVSCSAGCRALGCKSRKQADLAAGRLQDVRQPPKRSYVSRVGIDTHLVGQYAGLPDGCQQEVVGQELQALWLQVVLYVCTNLSHDSDWVLCSHGTCIRASTVGACSCVGASNYVDNPLTGGHGPAMGHGLLVS